QQEDKLHMTHRIAALGDTTRIACVGMIKNELGVSEEASSITIVDKTTGERIEHASKQAAVSFLGKKDHAYAIEIQNAKGDTTIHEVKIKADEKGTVTWNMVLKDPMMNMAARVVRADNDTPLGGALVKITTFAEIDLELVANEEGIVEFQLPLEAAYIVVGSKDGLTGLHSGVAEKGTDKSSVIHIVRAVGDPPKPVSVVAMITNKAGKVLEDAVVTVTDRATGENIPATVENGVLTFFTERGKNYNISVEHKDHQTTLEEISIPADAGEVEKIALTLNDKPAVMHTITAKVFKASDNAPLGGAQVKILNFAEPDVELVANAEGTVDFNLAEGTTFVVIGNKDGYTGMYSGTIESTTEKNSVVLVPAHNDPINHVPVVARITDDDGNLLTGAEVVVKDKVTGELIQAKVEDGVLTFLGVKGKEYTITVNDRDHKPASTDVSIPAEASDMEKVSIVLEDKEVIAPEKQMPVVATITDKKGKVLTEAQVVVTDTETGEKVNASVDKGVLNFTGEKGKSYSIAVEDPTHKAATQQVIIPETGTMDKVAVVLENKAPQLPVTTTITDKQGKVLTDAKVTVTDKATGKEIPAEVKNGVLSFNGEKGKTYSVTVDHEDYQPASKDITIPAAAT
ncbi:MAG TPA: carboxypeptidase-like regulatory domain-containing protein, partial [Ohtaekwangia sp.]